MKNKMMTVLLMALLLFNLCFIIHAEPETEQAVAEGYATNRIIVKYKENAAGKASAPSLSVEPREAQYTVKETLQLKKSKAEILEVNSTEEVSEVIAGLEADPAVEFAEPDYIVHANYDPSFDLQWGLNNTGQKMFGESGVAGQDINILPARAITQGEPSVIVAMVDGGMDIEHPDLDDNIFINDIEKADGYDNDDNGFIDDINGWNFADNNNNLMESYTDAEHGTHVAGIIAAESNDIGVEGVAPQVRILPLKFLKNNSGYTSDAIRAIEYAEKMGASIVNCSWGSSSPSSLLRETMANSDMLFVCAAGNYSSDAAENGHYPANFDLENVISAVAMDNRGNVADFSNYGGNNTIAAPGKDIYSTAPNENYTFMNGTSMAAPFVTGVAALIKSENPTLTNGEIKDKIKSSATNSAKLTDMVQANGYLDAAAALNNTSDSQYVIESHEYGGKTVRVNRNIYSAGGYDENGYSNRLSFYNAVTKQWYQAPDMPTARIHAGMAAARNDLYVVGGYNGQLLDEVEKYNTLTKTWSEAAPLPKALYASGVCCLNNKIFVFGGMDANGYSSAVYQYDPLEDVWQSASNMPVSAAYLSAVPVNDKIYLLGGLNGDGPKDVIYEYHPEDDTYEQKASMAYRRQNASAVELDGTIYILGGSNENVSDVQKNSAGKIAFTSVLTTVETYHPNSNTCEEIVDLPDSRIGFSAFEHNGEILLKGGWNGNYIDGTQAYIGAKVPLGLNAATNGSDIKLYWTKVEEATGYELEINGETVTVGSGVNEYTMTGESGYQVRIRSIFGEKHSAWSKYLVKQQYDTMRDAKQLVLSDTGLTEVIDTYPAGSSGIWFKTILESRGEGSVILACEQPDRYKIELYDGSGNLIAESRFEENTQKIAAIPAGYPMLYIKISGEEITQNESITLTIHYTATGEDSEIPDRVYVNTMETISPQDDPTIEDPGESGETSDLKLKPKTVKVNGRLTEGLQGGDATAEAVSIPMSTLRQNKTYSVTGTLSSSSSTDRYYVTLAIGEKLTAIVDAPGASEYNVYIYPNTNSTCSSWTWRDGFENPDYKTICECVAATSGSYIVEVNPRPGHESSSPYELRLYLTSQKDSYEPNFYPIPEVSKALNGVGGIINNVQRQAVKQTGLSIDHPMDKDYYRLDNIKTNEKITVELEMASGYENRLSQYSFEIWTLTDSREMPDGWTEYTFESYGVDNATAAGMMKKPNMKALSFIADNTPYSSDSLTYYIVVRESQTGSVVNPSKYALTCTRTPVTENSADTYEKSWYASNVSNDFIRMDGKDVLRTMQQNFTVNAVMDNPIDIDWYKIQHNAGSSKTITLGGSNYAKQNFDIVVFNAQLGVVDSHSGGGSFTPNLSAPGIYYIGVYTENWIAGSDQSYTLSVQSGAAKHFSIIKDSVQYNGINSGPMLGYNNELTFTLSNESASGKYYFEPRLGWSEDKLFSKQGVVTEGKEVTISPIELTSGGNSTLYTQIRIYNESKTMLLWESPIYSHTRNNEILPSNLELKKKPGGSMLYVNNPEKLSDNDVIHQDKVGVEANYLLFQQTDVVGENTLYATHSANGKNTVHPNAQFKGGFFYDVDFYNPSLNSSVAIWVTKQPNAFSVNEYAELSRNEDWLWDESADHVIIIPPGEHRLLFRDLMEQDSLWTATRTGVNEVFFIGLYANFNVEDGKAVTVSTLAAYDPQNLRLFGKPTALRAGSQDGIPVAKGDMRFDSPSETDLTSKFKGIDRNLNGEVITNLSYIFDDMTPNNESVPLSVNFSSDTFYGETGIKSPQSEWYTNINPINDNYFARYSTPVTGLEEYKYRDGYGVWDFGFKMLNGLAIDYIPKPDWFHSEHAAWVESWKGISDAAVNPPLNDGLLNYFKDAGKYGHGTEKPAEIDFVPESEKANTWDRTVINCSGWGIKQTTKIKLKNAGAKDNTFWYNLHSPGIISYCVKVTDEDGDIVTNNGRHWFEVGSNTDGGDMKLLGYGVQIPSGRTYDVTVTVLCGVNITGYHHTIGLGNNPLLS